MKWSRVKLAFTKGLRVRFSGRTKALKQIEEYAMKGTYPVIVIYGPEGCGKTALFKQAVEILKSYDYAVVHVNPIAVDEHEKLVTSEDIKQLLSEISEPIGSAIRLIGTAIEILYKAIRRGIRKKIALLADDVFQAIGLDQAEVLVKRLLNMIEYPVVDYEKIVVLVASSEGITRSRIGRHRWANMLAMWNMSREDYKELYEQIPGPKPPFNNIWKWTGGNPWLLAMLYEYDWNPRRVVDQLIEFRRLISWTTLMSREEKEILFKAVEDPDTLLDALRKTPTLVDKLIELNLVVEMFSRKDFLWIDTPPPEKDLEIGIGRFYAWQTPLHREAVKKALSTIIDD